MSQPLLVHLLFPVRKTGSLPSLMPREPSLTASPGTPETEMPSSFVPSLSLLYNVLRAVPDVQGKFPPPSVS